MYTILILFSVISYKAYVCINFELYESTPMISLYGLESAYCPPGNKPVVRRKGNTCLAWISRQIYNKNQTLKFKLFIQLITKPCKKYILITLQN